MTIFCFGNLTGTTCNGCAISTYLHGHLTIGTAQDFVVIQLKTGKTIAIGTYHAKDLPCKSPIGIHSFGICKIIDAGLLCFFENGLVIILLTAEILSKNLRGSFYICNFFGINVDGLAFFTGSQHITVTIINRAALTRNSNDIGMVGLCLSRQARCINKLQVEQAQNHQQKESYKNKRKPSKCVCGGKGV